MNEEPLIVPRGLEGNEPTHLSGLQLALAPHVDVLKMLWALVFVCVLVVVVTRHILIPLFEHLRKSRA